MQLGTETGDHAVGRADVAPPALRQPDVGGVLPVQPGATEQVAARLPVRVERPLRRRRAEYAGPCALVAAAVAQR